MPVKGYSGKVYVVPNSLVSMNNDQQLEQISYRSEGVSPENMEGDLYRAPGMEKFEIVKVMRGFRVSESRMELTSRVVYEHFDGGRFQAASFC